MQKWTLKNTWEELMQRVEYIEAYKLPYAQKMVIKEKEDWVYYDRKDELVGFSVDIYTYFTSITVYFTKGHRFWEDQFVITENPIPHQKNAKKRALIRALNKWERFIDKKEYEKMNRKLQDILKNGYKLKVLNNEK